MDLMSILIHKLISPTSYQMWSLYIIHIPVSLSTKITHPYEPLKCWQSTKIGINQKFQWFHSIYMYNYFNTQTDKCGIMCLKKKKKMNNNNRWTFVCCICAWNLQLTMNCPAVTILIKKKELNKCFTKLSCS